MTVQRRPIAPCLDYVYEAGVEDVLGIGIGQATRLSSTRFHHLFHGGLSALQALRWQSNRADDQQHPLSIAAVADPGFCIDESCVLNGCRHVGGIGRHKAAGRKRPHGVNSGSTGPMDAN